MSTEHAPGPDVSLDELVEGLRERHEEPDDLDDAVPDLADAVFNATTVDRVPIEYVRCSLDATLLAFFALRDRELHGQALRDDLDDAFGHPLSPATIYGNLHDLQDDGVLNVVESRTTKDYHVEDADAVQDEIETAAERHLAMALFLHAALEETES